MSLLDQNQVNYVKDILGVPSLLVPPSSNLVDQPATLKEPEKSAIKVEGDYNSPLLLASLGPLDPSAKLLFDRISGATKIPNVLRVTFTADVEQDELKRVFSMFKGIKAVAFGDASFEILGGDKNYFFDHFSKEIQLFGFSWVTTHSLFDMNEGEENQVQNLKRQVWSQLKNVIKEL